MEFLEVAGEVPHSNPLPPLEWTYWLSKLSSQLLYEPCTPCKESPSWHENWLYCLTELFNPLYHVPHLFSLCPLLDDHSSFFESGFSYALVGEVSNLLIQFSLFSSSCCPLGGQLPSLLQRVNPTATISALYLNFLTSPWAGPVWTAIKLTTSCPTSANTDEAAFLEAASVLLCVSVFMFAEIARNHWTKLFIGAGLVPTTPLMSPPATSWECWHSSTSLWVSSGTSFNLALIGNGFNVIFGLGVDFEVDFGFCQLNCQHHEILARSKHAWWNGGVSRSPIFWCWCSMLKDDNHPLDAISCPWWW